MGIPGPIGFYLDLGLQPTPSDELEPPGGFTLGTKTRIKTREYLVLLAGRCRRRA